MEITVQKVPKIVPIGARVVTNWYQFDEKKGDVTFTLWLFAVAGACDRKRRVVEYGEGNKRLLSVISIRDRRDG